MTIVFVSVVLNIHQAAIADELYRLTNRNYWFVETGDEVEENSKGGSEIDFSLRTYLIRTKDGKDCVLKALQLIRDADVVVYGAAPLRYLHERIRTGKVTFMYSERWLKKGLLNLLSPRLIKQQWFYHTHCYGKPFYALCSSAYAARDFNFMRSFIGRCYKWGYFVSLPKLDVQALLEAKRHDNVIKILWVGRLIDWKHPEKMLELAVKLKRCGVNFCINIIGKGHLFDQLKGTIQKFGLADCVYLLGSMSNEKVREVMLSHHIACFTSDRNEGWGAVLNEAMSCACCPVASIDAGSTPYLIKSGANGFTFSLTKKNSLYEKVLWLIQHPQEREQMSLEAYRTLHGLWSPQNAAIQLYKLCMAKLKGEELEINEGPCSKA